MNGQRLQELKAIYKNDLLDDIVPFWLKHSLDNAFIRHWNRLNRDQTPTTPETYSPGYCVIAMYHVVRDEGPNHQTWETFTFQSNTQLVAGGNDQWFCAEQ